MIRSSNFKFTLIFIFAVTAILMGPRGAVADDFDIRDILVIPEQTLTPGEPITIIWNEMPWDPPWTLSFIKLHSTDNFDFGITLWMGPYFGDAIVELPIEWELDIPGDLTPGEYDLVFIYANPPKEYYLTVNVGGNAITRGDTDHIPTVYDPEHMPEEAYAGFPPCDEVFFFYGDDVLSQYYTDQPSLNYSREELVDQMTSAMDRYVNDDGELRNDVGPHDAPFIAQSLDTSPLRQGTEDRLKEMVREFHDDHIGHKVTPGELFYMSLTVNNGNVKAALLSCHAVLYRDGSGSNAEFIENYCEPIRNPEGYSSSQNQVRRQAGREYPVSPRETAGNDQQGVWYHFFGMAALEFSDRNGYTPFAAVTYSAGMYKGEVAREVAGNFQRSDVGGRLSNYAVALENAIRSGYGAPPDPDKHCINYAGIAAGEAIARRLDRGMRRKPSEPSHSETILLPTAPPQLQSPMNSFMSLSPVSILVTGKNGEWFSFDQDTKMFDANTPWVFVDPIIEEDGTWGIVVSPLFEVDNVELTGTDNGEVTWAVLDHETRDCSVYGLDVQDGDHVLTDIGDHEHNVQHNGEELVPDYIHHYSAGFNIMEMSLDNPLTVILIIALVIAFIVIVVLIAALAKKRSRAKAGWR